MNPEEWVAAQQAAMTAIAPIFDRLEAAVNSAGPVDMVGAYMIALAAVQEVLDEWVEEHTNPPCRFCGRTDITPDSECPWGCATRNPRPQEEP